MTCAETSPSVFQQSFQVNGIKVLIVCRGPVRLEAMETLKRMGADYGILLSTKDSVHYAHTLAPELRIISNPENIHRVSDYTGSTQKERKERIAQIIQICIQYDYQYLFAGYGFMAEDAGFVEDVQKKGIQFIGPSSMVHRLAGTKDTAKKLARELKISVTPGLDNISTLTLLKKANGSREGLSKVAIKHGLKSEILNEHSLTEEEYAEALLQSSYREGKPLIHIDEIQSCAREEGEKILRANPNQRLRLKYIGGGGGKGQRIISQADEIPDAVWEILSESKVTGDTDNKNFLIELNIEKTRHNEIQLFGNGEWCISLGGRDCSIQMHEQKLVEISLTDELLAKEIQNCKDKNQDDISAVLEQDRKLLAEMEEQAERFGKAVALDSLSTFETIVSEDSFYFMEMNTRIQVEHRVTEMVYSLRFTNPEDQNDSFIVHSLIEAMVLVAVFKTKLPCPERMPRYCSGVEVRLNSQNDILEPSAGGIVEYWSPPSDRELRDEQGICIRNPDTGEFIRYHLAGAYDSNIALIATGDSCRESSLMRLSEILRCMEIRGMELQTNKDFHYGILNFCLSLHPMLKPRTDFVIPYICAIGNLTRELDSIDFEYAWNKCRKKVLDEFGYEGIEVFDSQKTLILRPLLILRAKPHLAAGFLMSRYESAYNFDKGKILWKQNHLSFLSDLYHYLHLEERPDAQAVHKIWDHDHLLLESGLKFYSDLKDHLGITIETKDNDARLQSELNDLARLDEVNSSKDYKNTLFKRLTPKMLEKCLQTHCGWKFGVPLLELLLNAVKKSDILSFQVDSRLLPVIPKIFLDPKMQKDCFRILSPPPVHSADTIVAQTGGMLYLKETPDSDPYLYPGKHFKTGDAIYIIEVMKMFNKIQAEFSGTVVSVLIEGEQGTVIKKGQPLFRVEPDEKIAVKTEEEKQAERHQWTDKLLAKLI